jgi:hypothetical protein
MDSSQPQPLDPIAQLTMDSFHHAIHTLCAALPQPVGGTPEDRIRRDNSAVAKLGALLTANADEIGLATQQIAAEAHALECMRLAAVPGTDPALARKLATQATSLMRQVVSTRRLLTQVQTLRQKRETDPVATDRAAWLEHSAIGLMLQALGRTPPAPMATPEPEPEPEDEPEDEPVADLAAEAELYAVIHPRRTALIRSLGGLPPRCDFGPPSPELLHAIVTGTTPHLCALDDPTKAAGPP